MSVNSSCERREELDFNENLALRRCWMAATSTQYTGAFVGIQQAFSLCPTDCVEATPVRRPAPPAGRCAPPQGGGRLEPARLSHASPRHAVIRSASVTLAPNGPDFPVAPRSLPGSLRSMSEPAGREIDELGLESGSPRDTIAGDPTQEESTPCRRRAKTTNRADVNS